MSEMPDGRMLMTGIMTSGHLQQRPRIQSSATLFLKIKCIYRLVVSRKIRSVRRYLV